MPRNGNKTRGSGNAASGNSNGSKRTTSRIRSYARKGLEKTNRTARNVKLVAGAVETGTAAALDQLGPNAGHKATPLYDSPTDVIVREESNLLPSLPCSITVNPLDTRKVWYAQTTNIHPTGVANSIIASDFDSSVYPAIYTLATRGIKLDVSTTLSSPRVIAWLNNVTHAVFAYMLLKRQIEYAMDSQTSSARLQRRDVIVNSDSTIHARMNSIYNAVSLMALPNNLFKVIDWLTRIYALGRTPNANIAQFSLVGLNGTTTPADVVSFLDTELGLITPNDMTTSGLILKVMPEWSLADQLKPVGQDPVGNADYDFNYLNVWVNHGVQDLIGTAPTFEYAYQLFNDNPNLASTGLSTIWSGSVWQPGFLAPQNTWNTQYIDDTTAAYTAMATTNGRLIGARRAMEYAPGGIRINNVDTANEAIAIPLSLNSLRVNAGTFIEWVYHVAEIRNKIRDLAMNEAKRVSFGS